MAAERAEKEKWVPVARAQDVEGPGPHAVSAGSVDLVLVRCQGGLRALEGLCPHQGALLGEGELDGDSLVCRNHRWRFDVASGQRSGGPQCLRRFPLREVDGQVQVDIGGAPADRGAGSGRRSFRDLPGPAAIPLIGNVHQLRKGHLHTMLESWRRKYGPFFRFRIGPQRFIAVADPDLMVQAMRARPDTFRRPLRVEEIFRELGAHGVFSSEEPEWRPQRRLAMNALANTHLKSFYPTLIRVAERLHRHWQRAAREGAVVDIQDDLMRFTVDVTTSLAFGRDTNTIEGGEDVLQKHLVHIFPALTRRLAAPFAYWRFIRSKADREVENAVESLTEWIGDLIAETRKTLAEHPERAQRPTNFMEAMLTSRDDSGQPFSEEIILGNALTMLLAGEDTTANSLSWSVHLLCDHPEAARALQREADEVLGGDFAPVSMDVHPRLRYATAVANEALRIHSVAPLVFLQAMRDVTVGDIFVPKGVTLSCLTRDPAVSEEHLRGARDFRPERWLDDEDSAERARVHIPFGTGPRICPGRSLAFVEMRLVLSMIYRCFDVERVGDSADVEEIFNFTVMPGNLRVRLREREQR